VEEETQTTQGPVEIVSVGEPRPASSSQGAASASHAHRDSGTVHFPTTPTGGRASGTAAAGAPSGVIRHTGAEARTSWCVQTLDPAWHEGVLLQSSDADVGHLGGSWPPPVIDPKVKKGLAAKEREKETTAMDAAPGLEATDGAVSTAAGGSAGKPMSNVGMAQAAGTLHTLAVDTTTLGSIKLVLKDHDEVWLCGQCV
jgi:hypothetical protein